MAGETQYTAVGNLTDDVTLQFTGKGVAFAAFTIASTPRVFDKRTSEWRDGETLFLRSVVWREFAEHCANSLTKGMRVIARGNLRQRSYDDKDGQRRTSYQLDIDEIGPSLRYATAQVTRTQQQGSGGGFGAGAGQQSQPWGNAPQNGGSEGGGFGDGFSDQSPF